MPLPLGHAAIGLAAYELSDNRRCALTRLKLFVFIVILANLPDIDVVVGLLLKSNGNAFHRGPAHSIAFSVIMGILASRAWKLSSQIPRMRFGICFSIILSHVFADYCFTGSPVSILWPFSVSWSSGYSGWGDVISSVLFDGFEDTGIMIGSAIAIIFFRITKGYAYRSARKERPRFVGEQTKLK